MGRWRPPQPKASPYVTPQGYAALQAELKELWIRRRDVVAALSAAAAEGDRSENAEYIYRKKELAGLDRRIRYLQKRLPDLTVVDAHANTEAIFFGATVELETDDEKIVRYRIVGADEAAADKGDISVDSPLAQALLKKRVDDEVEVNIGGTKTSYLITALSYPTD